MRILLEPALQLRQLHFGIEARPHASLLIRVLRVNGLQCWMHDEIVVMVLLRLVQIRFVIVQQRFAARVHIAVAEHLEVGGGRLQIDLTLRGVDEWQQLLCGRIRLWRQLIVPPLVERTARFFGDFVGIRKRALVIRSANLRQRYLRE